MMEARACTLGEAGQGQHGPDVDAAAQRLLPSGGAVVELASSNGGPSRGGAVRRRARVLERLESMDLEKHGIVDKQKLVGVADSSLPIGKAVADDAHVLMQQSCLCSMHQHERSQPCKVRV